MSDDLNKILQDIGAYLRYHKLMGTDKIPSFVVRRSSEPHPPPATPCKQGLHDGRANPPPATTTSADPEGRLRRLYGAGRLVKGREREGAQTHTNALNVIRAEIGDCRRCRLHESRTHIVFGVGNPNAELMFVGEGPGRDEDEQGEPFVGLAGQLLTKIIRAMGLKREDVYIANILKCRPPENRNPEPDEIAACSPFLFKQIEAIKPKVIVCLGTFAAQTLLKTQEKITRLRGKFYDWHDIKLMPTYHPAYLLRNQSGKKDVWEDMKKVMEMLKLQTSKIKIQTSK